MESQVGTEAKRKIRIQASVSRRCAETVALWLRHHLRQRGFENASATVVSPHVEGRGASGLSQETT
jgi:hypothetical protein